jgi:hypothetical protein
MLAIPDKLLSSQIDSEKVIYTDKHLKIFWRWKIFCYKKHEELFKTFFPLLLSIISLLLSIISLFIAYACLSKK